MGATTLGPNLATPHRGNLAMSIVSEEEIIEQQIRLFRFLDLRFQGYGFRVWIVRIREENKSRE